MTRFRISVDTGGTFTDVVVSGGGRRVVGKALTTPKRAFAGLEAALAVAAAELGLGVQELLAASDLLIYGTTRATNAIVTKQVAKTALLVTEGFPDILVLKEGGKFDPHDFTTPYPAPYIPRRHTFEIPERIGADGQVILALDIDKAIGVLNSLNRRAFEAIAVCLIWSVANPSHELAIGRLIEKVLPGVPYTLSHRLIPILREYRRASTTAIDASLKPLMQRHLRDMEQDLRSAGFSGGLLVSTSIGGCQHPTDVADSPVLAVKSGPAMAPVAGRVIAAQEDAGLNALVCDAGGTTFDVALVRDGALVYTRETWLGRRWTGDLISLSSVDVRSVGAGGGSIAFVDAGGLLHVGPASAGSDPGPACYGQGGDHPTVTDAALVLGYLDPAFFLGGRMALDVNAAHRVIERLAEDLGRSPHQAAAAILLLAGEAMMKAVREITVAEGLDPADSVLVAGGGAAGLNILTIARELGCRRAIVPRVAGALSAFGMQVSNIVAERGASLPTNSTAFDREAVNEVLTRLTSELQQFARPLQGRGFDKCRIEHFVEARYQFQTWDLEVGVATPRFATTADVQGLVETFHAAHERVFAVRDPGSPVEFLNWKARLVVELDGTLTGQPKVPLPSHPPANAWRHAWFGGAAPVKAAVFDGASLPPGVVIVGPALIEEPTSTLVVPHGEQVRLSRFGNYLVDFT